MSYPDYYTIRKNKKERKFKVGDIVKRKSFEDLFRIEEIVVKDKKPIYKLFNLTKKRYYAGVEEQYLELSIENK
jgi:hypothetical protein